MKQIFFFLLATLGIAVNATAQTGTGSTVMTGTQTQMIGGQKVFVSTGTQGTPLIGWSQSGASAGVITQDTHFDNPAFTIQRTGSDGDSTTTPTAIILAGKETAWNQPVLKVGGCLALSGDNYLTYWGNGSLSIPNGIYDNTGSTLGQLSIDPVHRQLVGTDGVTAKITWSGASVRLPSQTLSNSDSAMTLALADGRYAILSAANTWSAAQTFSSAAMTGNLTVSGTSWLGYLPSGAISGNYTLAARDCGTVIRATAAATLTLPTGLPVGFNVEIIQEGSGQVTFAAASGATLCQRQSYNKTAGQWAVASIIVNTANNYVLGGDLSN
ncbi:MAG: hypothetical protein ACFUZC_03425 [Chthoniobacteraceae bacterium]